MTPEERYYRASDAWFNAKSPKDRQKAYDEFATAWEELKKSRVASKP